MYLIQCMELHGVYTIVHKIWEQNHNLVPKPKFTNQIFNSESYIHVSKQRERQRERERVYLTVHILCYRPSLARVHYYKYWSAKCAHYSNSISNLRLHYHPCHWVHDDSTPLLSYNVYAGSDVYIGANTQSTLPIFIISIDCVHVLWARGRCITTYTCTYTCISTEIF